MKREGFFNARFRFTFVSLSLPLASSGMSMNSSHFILSHIYAFARVAIIGTMEIAMFAVFMGYQEAI
jgi:hypothetical protein